MLHEYFFQPIDLPALPDRFINEALNGDRLTNNLLVTGRDRTVNDRGRLYQNAKLHRWKLSQGLTEWLNTHGINNFVNVSIQSIDRGSTLGPHTDISQRCKLFYNLLPGGEKAETIWYQEKDRPLIREKFLLVHDTSNLIERFRCQIKPRQWGFINVGIIHQVKGLTSKRETVVASFEDYVDISSWL